MTERTEDRTVGDREYADRYEGRERADRGGYDDRGRNEEREGPVRERAAGPAVVQQRQRDEYGGFNFGAALFGWLVAVGMAVLLTALLSAAGAAIGLAVLGAIAGSEWNLFSQVNLPRIPIDEGSLATGGAIALAAILIGTLIAAIAGGKVGERYHRKVDRAGYEGPEPQHRAATA